MDARTATSGGFLAAIVNFALRKPGQTLAIVLGLHVVVWTALPFLTSPSLQLDLVEDLALGKEWQLGYWKHPPLPWWLADLAFRVTGNINAVYLLGPLTIAAFFIGVYLLARDLAGPVQALIATVTLEGIHYYNYSAVKFAHDQMQLPFWAFTALFLYRGIVRGRALDWLLAGAMLALAFWSKYAAITLGLGIALLLLFDPLARRTLRTPGPWLMAAAFLVVIAPNAWWLVDTGFLPFEYFEQRAKPVREWHQLFTRPVRWILSQVFFTLPALIVLAVVLLPRRHDSVRPASDEGFARRFVTVLTFAPFAVATVLTAAAGRAPVAMWGYPFWSLLPLTAILWFGPVTDPQRLRAFAFGFLIIFVAGPAVFAGLHIADQYWRERPKATEFPGQALAEHVTRAWRAKTGTPLPYVAGTEFAANSVAVYSPDRPHVVAHGRPQISLWIDMADLRKRGVVVLWEDELPAAHVEEWRKTFGAQGEPAKLVLPRLTSRPSPPVQMRYWIVPPRN